MTSASTWLDLPDDHPFGIDNLPYGVFSHRRRPHPRVGVRIGDQVLDAGAVARDRQDAVAVGDGPDLAAAWANPSLNAFLALGRPAWTHGAGVAHRDPHRRGPPRRRRAAPLPARRGHACTCRSRSPTTSTSTPASTTRPTSAGSSAPTPSRSPRTGSTCPSATTAASGTVVVSRHRRRPPDGAAQGPDRPGAGLRAEHPARHRGRAGLRRRRRAPRSASRVARRRGRRPPLRRRAPQRLERPRHPGLGVRPARPVPRQVVRAPRSRPWVTTARRPRARPASRCPARTPSRCPTCAVPRRRRHTGSTSTSRSSSTARSSRAPSSATCTGRPPRCWRT